MTTPSKAERLKAEQTKDRVNNLTVTVSNFKKVLEVKGQEVFIIMREPTIKYKYYS